MVMEDRGYPEPPFVREDEPHTVVLQLRRLGELVGSIDKSIEALTEQLNPILEREGMRIEAGTITADKIRSNVEVDTNSPLLSELIDISTKVAMQVGQLSTLKHRIQL